MEGSHLCNLLHDLPTEATPSIGEIIPPLGGGVEEMRRRYWARVSNRGKRQIPTKRWMGFLYDVGGRFRVQYSLPNREGCEWRGISLFLPPLMIAKRWKGRG